MKIIKTKDQSVIVYINDKIKEYIEREEIKEYTPQLFVKWVRSAILNPFCCVWVAMEDNKCLGYLIAQVMQTLADEKLTIVQLFGDSPEIELELLKISEIWAKNNGIKLMQVSTFHPKKWKDKEFKVVEHLLTKEI